LALELGIFFTGEKHSNAEDSATAAAGAHRLHRCSLITHQTTQRRNNVKITAGTQQDESLIRQLCEGNIKGKDCFQCTLHGAGCWKGDLLNSELRYGVLLLGKDR